MMGGKGIIILSELAFPPFGFVMTYNSSSPDDRLLDISHFAEYDYNHFDTFFLKTPILNTYLYLPGDYRTLDQIYKDYEANISDGL